jgi:Uma2 family endonuclease
MTLPRPKTWTCDEFHRLGDRGLFEGKPTILIDGHLLEMQPATAAHDTALSLLTEELRKIFSTGFVVRGQMSLVLGESTDPVPDLTIVVGSARSLIQKPTTAVLVVEVSDSSLDYDTTEKASLYASAGIADYWVIDLLNRQLIVFRDPQADSTKPFGFIYADISMHQPGQSVSPLAAPGSFVSVDDLLP